MTLYITPNGAFYDDMGGAALDFPGWPSDAVPATEEQIMAAANPTQTLAQSRKIRLDVLNAAAQELADAATADYPDFELQTWPDQRREAMAWNSDATTLTPYVDAIAQYRGVTREVLLVKIINAVVAFTTFATKVVGLRQKYADMIAASTSVQELDAIQFDFS